MTDHELLARFIESRDHAAFGEVVSRHIHLVYGVARRQAPADAEDVTQAVFLLLSQKARQVQKEHNVAGWLFRAARYCALNARKMGRRRTHHERQAGEQMRTISDETSTAVIEALDDALAALPRGYRDAVLLRYLEGRSVEETGLALGLSVAAAGKRATRGLELLREHFGETGYSLTPAAIGALLASESTKVVPLHVTTTVMAGFSGGAGGAKAAVLAKVTGKAMAGMVMKTAVAAGVVVAVGVGVGTLAVLHQRGPRVSAPIAVVSAPAPAVAAEEPLPAPPLAVDEKGVPGGIRVACYRVLLDGAGAQRVLHATQAAGGTATFYELRRGSAQAIREAMQAAERAKEMVSIGSIFNNSPLRDQAGLPDVHVGTSIGMMDIQRASGSFSFTLEGIDRDSDNERAEGGMMRLRMNIVEKNHPVATLSHWSMGENRTELRKAVNIQWDGTVPAGEAFAMVGDFGEWQGEHLASVIVYEAFKANGYQATNINYSVGAETWIQQGPTGLRALADRAWVWGHSVASSPAERKNTEAKWSRTLSDGSVIRLIGVGRMARFPFCWWDAEGTPTANSHWGNSVGLQTPLAAVMTLRLPASTPLEVQNDWEYSRYHTGQAVTVPEEVPRVSLYVPQGAWTEQAMKRGDEITLGDHLMSLWKTEANGPESCFAEFRGDWEPEYQTRFWAVLKDGKRVENSNQDDRNLIAVGGNDVPDSSTDAHFHVSLKSIDHFVVATRPREGATFEGFATMPRVVPRAVTPTEVAAANRLDEQWKERAAADAREADWEASKGKWAKFAAIPRDDTTPDGAMRVLIDKALAGDVAGVKERLAGKEPAMVNLFAEGLTTYEHVWGAAMQRFGEETMRRAIARRGVEMSEESEYLGRPWKIDGDRAVDTQGGQTLVRIHGKWRVDVDHLLDQLPKGMLEAEIQAFRQPASELINDLQAGKIPDAAAMADRLAILMDRVNTATTQPGK